MFYVIEIIEGGAGRLIGPKTWDECQNIMKNMLNENVVSCDDLCDFTQKDIKNGCYDNNVDYRVEIICCTND